MLLHGQSSDIAQGVDAKQPTNAEEGAGDQGIMFGYACNETPELMPAPIYYSHKILEDLARDRKAKKGDAAKLGPDSKSQVTVKYEDGKPVGVTQIVVSHQHIVEDLTSRQVRDIVEPYVRARPCRMAGSTSRPHGTSIRPASSTSAVRTAIAA